MKCEECKFFSNEWIGKPLELRGARWQGECRRHAPSPAAITYQLDGGRVDGADKMVWNSGCAAMWPLVESEHWCGEFLAKLGCQKGKRLMRDGTLQPLAAVPTSPPPAKPQR